MKLQAFHLHETDPFHEDFHANIDLLGDIVKRKIPLQAKKKLLFSITSNNTPPPYDVYWKVLNRGGDTYTRDCVRGQIIQDEGSLQRKETTNFRGEHIVECYIVKNGVVVAKDRIDVPIG